MASTAYARKNLIALSRCGARFLKAAEEGLRLFQAEGRNVAIIWPDQWNQWLRLEHPFRGYYMATPNGYAENLRSRTFFLAEGWPQMNREEISCGTARAPSQPVCV